MPKKFDLLTLLLVTLFSAIVSLYLQINFLSSTILIFGLPSLYLAFKLKNQIKKVAIFSLIFSIPFTFIFDYLIVKDHGWYIVQTIFPFRLFDVVVLEQFVWGFIFVFYTIIFYEYFLDKKSRKKDPIIARGMKWLSLGLLLSLSLFIYLVIYFSEVVRLNYAYAVLGILFGALPLTFFLVSMPKFTRRFLKGFSYFSVVALINEYVSLYLHHWIFPGNNFIGTTNFFGFKIPYEEIFFYFIIAAPIIFTYYEFFDDDRK